MGFSSLYEELGFRVCQETDGQWVMRKSISGVSPGRSAKTEDYRKQTAY